MAGEWLSDEEIQVEVQSLLDFAKHIQQELETNFLPSFEQGVKPMLSVQVPAMLPESLFFQNFHKHSQQAIGQMMGDAAKGLVSLSTVTFICPG